MEVSHTDTLEAVRRRLETLVEARLQGLSPEEQHEYQELIKREAQLLRQGRRAGSDAC